MRRPPTTTALGPRTWRAAVIVFLAVFIGGLMVSGAAALWSQQTTANLTLTTGTWQDPTPVADVPLDVQAVQISFQPGFQEFKLSWLPTRETDRQRNLAYTLSVVQTGGSGRVREVGAVVLEGTRHTATVRVDVNNQNPYSATFAITITPTVDGVAVPGTTRVLTISRNSASYTFS
ncbi:hypothetical protein LKO27_14970 [Tessaracoccus sp. OS52]|uniref:hypothetical protein n=1 Tax=Tessaracoccus sp. OS52 TaxID=2886691 RepID=UPI001D1251D5|nr:hypothetical protein [Tessaracoccus sp. OS52]MCC2594703.1 hypothetical protein [Tessaracoccus sp. OS52]